MTDKIIAAIIILGMLWISLIIIGGATNNIKIYPKTNCVRVFLDDGTEGLKCHGAI